VWPIEFERAVILTDGPALRVLTSEFRGRTVAPSTGATTLEATGREAILRALQERTTLQSRIQKLGIARSTT